MKNPNPEIPFEIEFIQMSEDVRWNPLYKYLKEIFGDKYLDSADGFMFMSAIKYWNGIITYEYKHGVTRRAIQLLEDGTPVKSKTKFKNEVVNGKKVFNTYISELNVISNYDAFIYIYENIDNFYGSDGVFTKYSDYIVKRDEMLKENGYNVVTINPNQSIENIANSIKKSI